MGGVEDRESADEVEEAVGAAEGVDGVGLVRLPPAVPELFRRADGCVACLLAVEREEELSEVKEVRDVLSALVADQPGSGFPAAPGRPLVLDDDEGDAVDEGDDIEAAGLETARAFHLHAGGDVVDVVGGIVPVDIAKRVGPEVTGDPLRDGGSEHEEVVDLLVGAAESQDLVGGGGGGDGWLRGHLPGRTDSGGRGTRSG